LALLFPDKSGFTPRVGGGSAFFVRHHGAFMSDIDFKVNREVHELRAEVRWLRRTVEAGFLVAGSAAVVIFPQLLMLALVIGVLVLLAFLVSPVRRMIFTSIFQKRDGHEHDA
jgi:hypothetical protein